MSASPPTSDVWLRRSELTLRASSGLMRCNKSGRFRNWLSGVQLVEQRLRLLQIKTSSSAAFRSGCLHSFAENI